MKDMLFFKMLKFFLENPFKEVYLRELAKKLKISPFATKKYADMLAKEKLILSQKKANLRYLKSNNSDILFKHLKIALNIKKIRDSGIGEFLKNSIPNLSSIVIFGSIAKGEDAEESDIDLVLIGSKNYINIKKFEDKIQKEINIHIFSWGEWKKKMKDDSPFYYEVISYGIPIYGELPIVK